METFDVDGFPETKLALALFKSVKNATDLKRKHLHQVALIDSGEIHRKPVSYSLPPFRTRPSYHKFPCAQTQLFPLVRVSIASS